MKQKMIAKLEKEIEPVSERNRKRLRELQKEMNITHFRPFIAPDTVCSIDAAIADCIIMLELLRDGKMENITHRLEEFLD